MHATAICCSTSAPRRRPHRAPAAELLKLLWRLRRLHALCMPRMLTYTKATAARQPVLGQGAGKGIAH
eukprot:scaffold20725_cov111-Isochrysis_galbana.AAC.10